MPLEPNPAWKIVDSQQQLQKVMSVSASAVNISKSINATNKAHTAKWEPKNQKMCYQRWLRVECWDCRRTLSERATSAVEPMSRILQLPRLRDGRRTTESVSSVNWLLSNSRCRTCDDRAHMRNHWY